MINHTVASQYDSGLAIKKISEITDNMLANDIANLSNGKGASRHIQLIYHFDPAASDVRHRSITLTHIDTNMMTVEYVESSWSEPSNPGQGKSAISSKCNPRHIKVWNGQTYYKLSEIFLISLEVATAIAVFFAATSLLYPNVDWISVSEVDLSPALQWHEYTVYEGDCVWL